MSSRKLSDHQMDDYPSLESYRFLAKGNPATITGYYIGIPMAGDSRYPDAGPSWRCSPLITIEVGVDAAVGFPDVPNHSTGFLAKASDWLVFDLCGGNEEYEAEFVANRAVWPTDFIGFRAFGRVNFGGPLKNG